QMNGREQTLRLAPNARLGPPPAKPEPPDPDPNVQFPGLIFCTYCAGPEEMLKNFFPVSADKLRRAGKPYPTLDKVLAVIPDDPDSAHTGNHNGFAYFVESV